MDIRQGDVFWVTPDRPQGAEPGISHPHVVVQVDGINGSVTVCALTTNRKRASLPGNVLLEAGEANLPKPSVVEVAKLSAVDKAGLGDHIGTLGQARVEQILAGIRFVQRLRDRSE